MQIVNKAQTTKIAAATSTIILEYLMPEKSISGAIAEINGRYPEIGLAVNKVSKELAFVLSGKGSVITQDSKRDVEVGDVIFIDKGKRFAWQGNFQIFMVTTPKFDPKQHIIKVGP